MKIENCLISNIGIDSPFIEGSRIEIDDRIYNSIETSASEIFHYKQKPNEPPVQHYADLINYIETMEDDNEVIVMLKTALSEEGFAQNFKETLHAIAIKQWHVLPVQNVADPFTAFITSLLHTEPMSCLIPVFWMVRVLFLENVKLYVGDVEISPSEYVSTILNYIAKVSVSMAYKPRSEMDVLFLKTFKYKQVFKVSPMFRRTAILNAMSTIQTRTSFLKMLESQVPEVARMLQDLVPCSQVFTPHYMIWAFLIQNIPETFPNCGRVRFTLQLMMQLGINIEDAEKLCSKLQEYCNIQCMVPQHVTVEYLSILMSYFKKVIPPKKRTVVKM